MGLQGLELVAMLRSTRIEIGGLLIFAFHLAVLVSAFYYNWQTVVNRLPGTLNEPSGGYLERPENLTPAGRAARKKFLWCMAIGVVSPPIGGLLFFLITKYA